jgi:hypothetical protein
MKTQDQVVDVAKKWMAEIGDLRGKYPLRVVMRDNAGKSKSKALAELAIKSTIMTAICGMAESGMVGKFSCKVATNGKNCQNVAYKWHINSTLYQELYRKEEDLSRFRQFGCLAYRHVHKDRSERGRPRRTRCR